MYENGICQVTNDYYTIQLMFSDINYRVAQRDEQIDIFSKYCEILNYFDPEVHIQITTHNRKIDKEAFKEQMLLKMQDNEIDEYRQEYNNMLLDKSKEGQNSIIKEKYITVGITAESYNEAYPALKRLETDLTIRLKTLGCEVTTLSGTQRLEYINSILNPDEPLKFDYDYLIGTGLNSKDFIAPYYFNFATEPKKIKFEFGDYYGQVLMIKKFPSDLGDKILNDLSELPCNISINIHTQTVENAKALNKVQTKLAFMEQEKMGKQQKLLQQLADPEMIPEHLKKDIKGCKSWLDDLQNNNQRMFQGAVIVFTSAKSLEELDNNVAKLKGIALSNSCELMPLACEQESGLNATLPFAKMDIPIRRCLTTAAQAIFIPFTTQELFQQQGFYYGLNSLSKNLLFFSRKSLKNPAGFVLGTPGSGKSFATKRELINILLDSKDDEILVIDPESEYGFLCQAFGGSVVKLSMDTDTYFNPLDITLDYSGGDDEDLSNSNPLKFKTEFIFSFLDVIVTKESGMGLSGAERTLVDLTLRETYKSYFKNPNAPMPTLVDFYSELKKVKAPEFQTEKENLLKVLGLYVTGSFNLFSHNTNIDVNNKFVVYDIKDLGDQIKTLGMLVVLDQIWNRVTSNRKLGRKTWIVIDEAHLLFANEFSASFLSSLWKRARKYGGICTGITQNVEDLLESDKARKMLYNSEFIMMLNQFANERKALGELLAISPAQLGFVTNSPPGQGLLFAGKAAVPFIDQFPTNTKLYKMMSSKLEDVVEREKEEAHQGS